MKKSVYLWLLLLAIVATSCKKDDNLSDIPGASGYSWSVKENIDPTGGLREFTFTAAEKWKAVSGAYWCSLTQEGESGKGVKLIIQAEPNNGSATRETTILITFTNYKTVSFKVSQAPYSGPPITGDTNMNPTIDQTLAKYYLWNDEYKQMTRDLTLPFVSSNDNFMTRSLLSMTTNIYDKKKDSQGNTFIYSYIVRTSGKSNRAATKGVNHGVKKEAKLSYGIAGMAAVQLSDQSGNLTNNIALVIGTIYPGSSAEKAGLKRGVEVVSINGSPITVSTYQNDFQRLTQPGSGTVKVKLNVKDSPEYQLTAESIYPTPVIKHEVIQEAGHKVGYLNYHSFDAGYDDELLAVIATFKSAGITDLILDLRNNGGGHVISSNMLATCIAGTAAQGKIYQYYRYNDTRMANPSETSKEAIGTYDEGKKMFREDFSYSNYFSVNLASYALNLKRLYVLCTENTASASEAVINSLEGIDIEVVMIGQKTSGKNVGMEPKIFTVGNYSYEMAAITFQGYNAKAHSVDHNGMSVDMQLDEWQDGFVDYDKDEPLIAAALTQITGVNRMSVHTRAVGAQGVQRVNLPLPKNTYHPEGMIQFPKDYQK